MRELVTIHEGKDGQYVSLRELYNFLEVKSEFAKWAKRMFEYDFVEGQDYSLVSQKRDTNNLAQNNYRQKRRKIVQDERGRPETDYHITLDCAKEIAMLQRSEKGKQARQYFIEAEKRLRELAKPLIVEGKEVMSLDAVIATAQHLKQVQLEQAKLRHEMNTMDDRVTEIEAKTSAIPDDHYTVTGYARLHKHKITLEQAKILGTKARAECLRQKVAYSKMPDPRFGMVGVYPRRILDELWKAAFGVSNEPPYKALTANTVH